MEVSLTLSIFLYFPLLIAIPHPKLSLVDKLYNQTEGYKNLHLQSDWKSQPRKVASHMR